MINNQVANYIDNCHPYTSMLRYIEIILLIHKLQIYSNHFQTYLNY